MEYTERKVEEIDKAALKDWMSAKEAVAYLGITLMTLTAWSKKGLLEKRKVGGKVYFDSGEVKGLIKASTWRVN